MSHRFTRILALALLALCFTGTAHAEYPKGPISIICPFGAGGAGDLAARILANAVKNDFAKPVVVVNKPGAAGVLGTTVAFRSKPDGQTLLIGRVANAAIIPALNKTIQYKWDSFVFLGLLDLNPLVVVVHKDSPYKTLRDLADAVKANPGKLTFSTAGALNIQEIASYMLLHAVGLGKDGAVSVPFQSDAAGKNAILGGHVDFGAINLAAAFDQLGEGGKLRALAVTTAKRLPKYPDIPTVREAGFPELENILAGTPCTASRACPRRPWTSGYRPCRPSRPTRSGWNPRKTWEPSPISCPRPKPKPLCGPRCGSSNNWGRPWAWSFGNIAFTAGNFRPDLFRHIPDAARGGASPRLHIILSLKCVTFQTLRRPHAAEKRGFSLQLGAGVRSRGH